MERIVGTLGVIGEEWDRMWEALFETVHAAELASTFNEEKEDRSKAVNRHEEWVTCAERLLRDVHIDDDEENVSNLDFESETDGLDNSLLVKEDLDNEVEDGKASIMQCVIDNAENVGASDPEKRTNHEVQEVLLFEVIFGDDGDDCVEAIVELENLQVCARDLLIKFLHSRLEMCEEDEETSELCDLEDKERVDYVNKEYEED